MKKCLCAVLIALAAFAQCVVANAQTWPDPTWVQSDPATAGWSVEKLAVAEGLASRLGATAVMVVQHGNVLASWGKVTEKVRVASVRKSLLSALYGVAVEEGRINLRHSIKELGIDDFEPKLTEIEKTEVVPVV